MTWTSNIDKNIRNQMDYININKRFKNSVKNVKAYPGADLFTDHNLLMASLSLRLKKCVRGQRVHRLELQRLSEKCGIKSAGAERLEHKINKYMRN